MAKQDLRKMKEQKNVVDKEAISKAQNMLGKDITGNEMQNINQMADMAKQYEGKSETELTNELLKVTEQSRKDGTLNNEMLETFYRSMSPMMNAEQKSKLDGLMKMLKR
jgi:DNA-binding transcriptional regulator YbjK